MNKIEKIVYDCVKSAPWLKFIVRNLYQAAFDLFPRKKEFSKNPIDFKEGYFFGFHDKSPFSEDGEKLLANKYLIPLRMPLAEDVLEVGYFQLKSGIIGDFIKIGESKAWNYHKGCRIQWIDTSRLIYNTSLDGNLVSKIVNIDTKNEQIIDFPIDTMSNDGKLATSFSYSRLQRLMPGYGYPCQDENFLDEKAPKETGLFVIDLEKNTRKLLVSLNELAEELEDISLSQNYSHYVTHSEFSFDGRYISFLHRWTADDIRKRTTRLVIYDLRENTYFVAPTDGMVSHYVWNSQNQIVAYCSIEGQDCHVLFNVPNINEYKMIAALSLNSDGHQSFVSDTSFVTDTYPDRFRMAKLYSVDTNSAEAELIASVYSPKKFQTKDFQKHIACDLHPRVSSDGKFICFDSVRTGKRSICVMPL